MAGWNGSDRRGDSIPVQPKVMTKKPSPIRGVLAGGLVVILAVVGYFVFFAGKDEPRKNAKERRPATIKEVKPVVTNRYAAANRDDLRKKIEERTGKPIAPYGYYTNKEGKVVARTRPPFIAGGRAVSRSLFASPAENQLDGLVNTPLGGNYYDYDVPENFEEQFAFSLTNRIVIKDDDPPDIAARKQRVIDAKEELVKAKKEGRDLRQVMLEAKQEMKKKFEDYIFFEQGLTELRVNNASDEEIAEYALAAKKMMEEKGIEERLHLSPDQHEAMEKMERLINGGKPAEGDGDASEADAPKTNENLEGEQ